MPNEIQSPKQLLEILEIIERVHGTTENAVFQFRISNQLDENKSISSGTVTLSPKMTSIVLEAITDTMNRLK